MSSNAQKNATAHPIGGTVLIFLSALCWSLYALYAEFSRAADIWSMIFWSQLAAAVLSALLGRDLKKALTRAMAPGNRWLTFWITLFPVAHQWLFLAAVLFIPTSSALFVFELWPVALLFVVAILIRPELRAGLVRATPIFLVATIGLALVGWASHGMVEIAESDMGQGFGRTLVGLTLAFMACIATALTALKINFSDRVLGVPGIRTTATSNFVSRVLSLPVLAVLALVLSPNPFDPQTIGISIMAGVLVHTLSAIFGDEGIRISSNSSSYLMFYYAPLIGAALLVIVFNERLSDTMLLGALLILVANIYSGTSNVRRISFPVILGLSVLYLGFCYVTDYAGVNVLDHIAVVGVFFTVIAAFVMQRQHSRIERAVRSLLAVVPDRKTALTPDEVAHLLFDRSEEQDPEKASARGEFQAVVTLSRHPSDTTIIGILYVALMVLCFALGTDSYEKVIVSTAVFLAGTFIAFSTLEMSGLRFLTEAANRVIEGRTAIDESIALWMSLLSCLLVFSLLFFNKFGGDILVNSLPR